MDSGFDTVTRQNVEPYPAEKAKFLKEEGSCVP
jgi:hypothetical protein